MNVRSPDPEIVRGRHALARIDRAIVRLLAARERTQRRLLTYKVARARPLFDPVRERQVLDQVRSWSRQDGADPFLATEVVLAAMRSGLRRFTERSPYFGVVVETSTGRVPAEAPPTGDPAPRESRAAGARTMPRHAALPA